MPYHLWMGNIVNIATDAIVNAANTELKRTPGICEAIFAAADSAKLEEACRRHGHCPIGHSVMTPSFGLPARYIIHVAGPGWFAIVNAANTELKRTQHLQWQTATAAP